MRYRDGYQKNGSSGWKAAVVTLFLSVLLLVAFAGAVYLFRKKDVPAPPAANADASAPVVAAADLIPQSARAATITDLVDQRSGQKVGTASRGQKDGLFEFTVAMNPPAIDRATQAYVVWLLRPLPFDFFPLGEMVTNDAGAFVTDWTGAKDKSYDDYTHVIIMLQPAATTPDAGAQQVIKGTFGGP